MDTHRILVGIADDHTLFRNGVAALMDEFDELQIVFQVENGARMQQVLNTPPPPDVILMDINMPVMDGYEATCWLKEKHPKIKVLALSMFEDEKAIVKMIRCGALGYVLKESKPKDLLLAITTIYKNGIYVNDLVTGKLIRSLTEVGREMELSERETIFLSFCCSELTYKEIADKMIVSPRTVDNYRESLFLKLNLKSRSGLVLYAIQNGIFKF